MVHPRIIIVVNNNDVGTFGTAVVEEEDGMFGVVVGYKLSSSMGGRFCRMAEASGELCFPSGGSIGGWPAFVCEDRLPE